MVDGDVVPARLIEVALRFKRDLVASGLFSDADAEAEAAAFLERQNGATRFRVYHTQGGTVAG
jgi:hypothetical protein